MVSSKLIALRYQALVLFSCLVTVGIASTAEAQSWNLATDFSSAANPNGVWTYGYLTGSTFNAFTQTVYSAPFGSNAWYAGTLPNVVALGKNTQASIQYGVSPGQVSLESDYGTPDARWTAPTSGTFDISAEVGGTLVEDVGFGNTNAHLSGLQINGVSQAVSNVSNNIYSWTLNNVNLTAGEMVDVYVGEGLGAGNTNTLFTVDEVFFTPEPGTMGLMIGVSISAAALMRRRYRR